jgi:LuxR family maltose regulon positive regulatory protein
MRATSATDALAATKFMPPRLPVGWVPRPRLAAQLETGLESPVTLLAATAGAGKSALLGAWAATRESGGPVAWLSLDVADSDRHRFWSGVLHALARARVPEPVASLTAHPAESIDLIVPALVNALFELEEPVVLVLDDLHELREGGVLADLDRLLRQSPPALRLVIATRSDPPLRLGRLRLAGELTEIREADLAFTERETGALLRAAGVELAPADVTRLWRRTEGWAAGLRLAALTLRGHPDPPRFVAAFAGDDAAMADYLLAEVLARQPDDLVEFLLRTSVVDFVCGELADAITGRTDGGRVLAQLEREHALVTALGDDRPWHRYHPLLRELLRSQLAFRMPEEIPEIHRRASRWYLASGRPSRALRHAAHAGDWDSVAAVASDHWLPLLVRGELSTLREVLERLPEGRAQADPEVALALAALKLDQADGDGDNAEELYGSARAGRELVPAARRACFDLGVAAVGLMRARLRGDVEAAQEAARELAGDSRAGVASGRLHSVAADLRALALLNLGLTELWTGELESARRNLESGRLAAKAAGRDWLVLVGTVHLGFQAALAGRLVRAQRRSDEGLELAARNGWLRTWPAGIAEGTLSCVALERNRLADAEAHFARGDELLSNSSYGPLRVAMRLMQARLLIARGCPELALEALEAAREAQVDWPVLPKLHGLIAGLEALALAAQGRRETALQAIGHEDGVPASAEEAAALAQLELLDGDPGAARAAVAPWLDGTRPALGSTATELWLLDAVASDAAADHAVAATSLERALDEAEPSGIRRPFVARGPAVALLLRRQLRNGTAHRSLVESLLGELERPAGNGRSRALLVESLSHREAAVLRFLPTMMSNREIASELFVSVNTVKTHLKSIYRKLDVADRREAVRRARELSLLGP